MQTRKSLHIAPSRQGLGWPSGRFGTAGNAAPPGMTSRCRGLGLVLLGLCLFACSGPSPSGDRIPDPGRDVMLSVQWRVELVDSGIWPYEPTELGRIETTDDGQLVFVGLSDGRMVSVDGGSGRLLWELEIGEPVDSWPRLAGGTLFFGATNGSLYALDALNGDVIWQYEAGGSLDSRPAVTDSRVTLAIPGGTVVCLDRTRATPLWTVSDDEPALRIMRERHPPVKGQASPTIEGDRVFVGFPSGRLAAIGLSDGVVDWIADLAGDAERHVDVDEPPILIEGMLIGISFSGGMVALNPDNGHTLWHAPLRGATRPVRYGQRLLTTTVDGRFVSLDLQTGQSWFSLQVDDRSPGPVFLIGDYALFTTSQGALYVVSAASPHIFTQFRPTGGFASLAVADNGSLFALDNQGVLYRLLLHWR